MSMEQVTDQGSTVTSVPKIGPPMIFFSLLIRETFPAIRTSVLIMTSMKNPNGGVGVWMNLRMSCVSVQLRTFNGEGGAWIHDKELSGMIVTLIR